MTRRKKSRTIVMKRGRRYVLKAKGHGTNLVVGYQEHPFALLIITERGTRLHFDKSDVVLIEKEVVV